MTRSAHRRSSRTTLRRGPPQLRLGVLGARELVVDNFAGCGGASTGVGAAIGREVDIAINHSPTAILAHTANHPTTLHLTEDVYRVSPREVCGGRPVGLAWFSPDCTHHSKAANGKPKSKKRRGLAWVAIRWAKEVRPRVIVLENVCEWLDWGPLDEHDRPIASRKGETFRAWRRKLERYGYVVEHRVLVAADYGAPTTRKRLCLVARCDGQPIAWPEPTHGPGRRRPWRTAAEVIDWTIPCPSIFDRRKPLAEATQRRIATGVMRYVVNAARPFIVPVKTWGGGGNGPRSIDEPMRTVTTSKRGEFAIVAAWLAKHYGGVVGHEVTRPLGTVTTQDHHSLATATLAPAGVDRRAEVRAFLISYYGQGTGQDLGDPLRTVTTRDRFGLVTVEGVDYEIADIGMRMLAPHELAAAQGFPVDYVIAPLRDGKPISKTEQIELIGNSVCPPLAEAIVRANYSEREAVAA